jgi:hypothetical protein
MTSTTHSARLNTPLPYRKPDGTPAEVPSGACLMEQAGAASVSIIWGSNGQNSATLDRDLVKAAADAGHLVLLD